MPCRTAQGHKLRDQARIDSAAAIVDTAFQRLLGSEYGPALAAAHKLKHQGQAGDADQGPAKRQRLANPLLPQQRGFHRAGAGAAAAAAAAAGRSDVDEVITAFMNGEDGFGPSNTQVCRKNTIMLGSLSAWIFEVTVDLPTGSGAQQQQQQPNSTSSVSSSRVWEPLQDTILWLILHHLHVSHIDKVASQGAETCSVREKD
jgi:hypothetical protein